MLLNVHARRKILRKGLDKIHRLTGHGELRRMDFGGSSGKSSGLRCFTFLLSDNRDLLPVLEPFRRWRGRCDREVQQQRGRPSFAIEMPDC